MLAIEFIHDISWGELPESVQDQARRCLLDTIGAAAAGSQTKLSQIVRNFSASVYSGQGAQLWFDGRQVSAPGAALANGMTIDALDIHDGHNLTKGHAGAALVPAAMSTASMNASGPVSGEELLTALVVGYEVALRAGIALHASAHDYHTSGAWNALGCAAIAARFLNLNIDQSWHALGISEYHGPRSQMMRCIDHPTMVKDGSGWGSMTGVSAALLAKSGFTGGPPLLIEEPELIDYWTDLGAHWRISEQYFKPYAVCRWAQPAIAGALKIRDQHAFDLKNIQKIQVFTFHEAVRLDRCNPETTEEAQYSLPFPVAAALVHKQVGPLELSVQGLGDPSVLNLANKIELIEEPAYSERFPAERLARVISKSKDGSVFDSGEVTPRWSSKVGPANNELREKFRWLAGSSLSAERASELEVTIWQIEEAADISALAGQLAAPLDPAP